MQRSIETIGGRLLCLLQLRYIAVSHEAGWWSLLLTLGLVHDIWLFRQNTLAAHMVVSFSEHAVTLN